MKKIGYILTLILLTQFSCKTTKVAVNKTSETQIESIKEILSKPEKPIIKALKSNRDSVFTIKYDTYQIFSKNGKLIENSRFENDGSLYQKSKNELDKNGKLIKGIRFNSTGGIKEKWNYIYDKNENLTEVKYYSAEGELTNIQQNVYDKKGNKIEMLRTNLKRNTVWKDTYVYNGANKKVEQLNYKPDGSLKGRRTYNYNEKGNKFEELYYKPDGTIMKFVSEYDEMDNLIIQNWFNEQGEQTHQTSFEYIYDKNGNWITKKRSSKGVLSLIWERQIKYYE